MRISDCEFQLPYGTGEGYDARGCGKGQKYGNRKGVVFAACEVYVRHLSLDGQLSVWKIGRLIWKHSALLYAGRRCNQIGYLELLLQEPQGQDYRPWGYGGCDAED